MVEGNNSERNDAKGLKATDGAVNVAEMMSDAEARGRRLCVNCSTKPCSWTNPNYPKCFRQAQVPHVRDYVRDEAEVQRLKDKGAQGTINVVAKVMEDPKVKRVLKSNINKQTFISGMFMGFIIVGILMDFTVLKTLMAYDWRGDLIAGTSMLILGLAYVVYMQITTRTKSEEANPPKTTKQET